MGESKLQFMEQREHEKLVEENPKTVKQFKIGCASISKIMGVKGLGKTGEGYLKEWYLTRKYNRKKDFFALAVEKGLRVEPIGIKMLGEKLNLELDKNDEWFENDFLTGIPDIVLTNTGYDTKCSWSIFTFPFFDKELINEDYQWQGQGYMALTGYKNWYFAYLLIDTPRPLIDQELKKLYYQSGGKSEDWNPETYEELAENYKFNDIPVNDRIRIFEVKRDEEKIKKIYERVQIAREYINLNCS